MPALHTYPGRLLKKDVAPGEDVRAVQRRLDDLGFGPLRATGRFDARTDQAVRRFQAASSDAHGMPLEVDGRVGAITWEALFGRKSVPSSATPGTPFLRKVLAVAAAECAAKVREDPPGSNRGPRVDQYLRSVALDPGHPWCAAFVYWCFEQAAGAAATRNPCVKTGAVLRHWELARSRGISCLPRAKAEGDPSLVRPGMVFVFQVSGPFGHTGLVEAVAGGVLTTIEGNTNVGGSREGVGVFRRTGRKIADINRGFVYYESA